MTCNKSHPAIFASESVRGIRRGLKTQTRRLIKKAPANTIEVVPSLLGDLWDFRRDMDNPVALRCPFGKVGDGLWVKESFSLDALHVYPCPNAWYRADIDYLHDSDPASGEHRRCCKGPQDGKKYADCFACVLDGVRFRWRSPMFMPREFSRTSLDVTDVRVQRLQDISEDDAWAEGIEEWDGAVSPLTSAGWARSPEDPRAMYAAIWESMHGVGSWLAPSWVYAVTFRAHTGGAE